MPYEREKMVRKVVTRSPHREVGVVNPGWLLDHPVHHESHLERRFIMVALSCPVVTDIVHQPFEVWLGPNETQKYTPDFQVTLRDGASWVIEVKPDAFVLQNEDRFKLAERVFASMGHQFQVLTEKQIDTNGLSARAILLMRYGRIQFSDTQASECLRLMTDEFDSDPTVNQLVERGVSEALVWNLVAKHRCRVPAGLSISGKETVSLNNSTEDCDDHFCTWFGIAAR